MSLISHFAERNGLSIPQVYRYVKRYGGICLVDEHYDIMHTLRFIDALESMTMYMNAKEGCGMINYFIMADDILNLATSEELLYNDVCGIIDGVRVK